MTAPNCSGGKIQYQMKINNEISEIFKSLNFLAESFLYANEERRHYIVAGRIADKEVLIKIYHKSNESKAKNLEEEWRAGEILRDLNLRSKKKINIIESLDFGRKADYVFLVRKYYKGTPFALDANTIEADFYFDKFSMVEKKFQLSSEKIANGIISNILVLKNTKGLSNDGFNITKRDRFPQNYSTEIYGSISMQLKIDLNKTKQFLDNMQKDLSQGINLAVQTNDLTPTNIFITDNNEVLFSDFEWLGLENYLIDTAFLWLLLWRFPDWQSVLLNKIIVTEIDRDFFRVNVIRLILYYYQNITRTDLSDERDSFYKMVLSEHIWKKYLIAAGESFEAIMQVR